MGRVLGVPYHVIGMGAAPSRTLTPKRWSATSLSQTDSLLVRDSESVAVLEDAGVAPGPDPFGP